MEDRLIIVAVVLLGIAGIAGIAYSLEARRKRRGSFGPKLPPPGPIGRALWRTARIIAAGMTVTVVIAYVLRAPAMAWLTVAGFMLFFAAHAAYRVVRLTGK